MKTPNIICLLFTVTLLITLKAAQAQTPIIGIVSIYSQGWDDYDPDEWNYIPGSYIRWIQSAGAKVVPIQWDLPLDQIDSLLDRLNGVVFIGGNVRVLEKDSNNITPIYRAISHITEYVLEKNQQGHFYPLWGTCIGFWNIVRSLAGNTNILATCDDCVYVRRNIDLNEAYESKMLSNLPQDLAKKIKKDRLSAFLHGWMVTPLVFQRVQKLSKYFTPVAYSYDASGNKYVSMAESPSYPIYATQFHPEKPEFERKAQYNIPHSPDAIRFARYLANFFVGEAKKNGNVFPNNEKYLIDNYSPVPVPDSAYSEVYFFPAYKYSKVEIENDLKEVGKDGDQSSF